MNRRNDPVEELVDGAREAVHDENYEHAISLLREANRLAPMRQDIRQFLAAILEGTSAESETPMNLREPAAVRANETAPAPAAFRPERGMALNAKLRFSDSPGNASGEEDSTPFPTRRVDSLKASRSPDADEEASRAEPSADSDGVLKFSLARRLAQAQEIPAQSGAHAAEPFVPYSEMRGLADPSVCDAAGESATIRDRRKRGRPGTASEETGERAPVDGDGAGSRLLRFPPPSARFVAFASVYTCIALFVVAASVVTHRRFFRTAGHHQATTAASPSTTHRSEKPQSAASDRTEEEIIRLAGDYFQNERFDDCIALLSRAVKSGGPTATTQRMSGLLASAYEARGTRQLLANQIAESAKSYEKAVDLSPENPDYALRLGNAYFYCATSLGNSTAKSYYNKSLKMLTHTVELDPRNVQAYELLASVYVGLEKTSQAQAALVKIVEIAPSSDEAELARRKLKTLTMAE